MREGWNQVPQHALIETELLSLKTKKVRQRIGCEFRRNSGSAEEGGRVPLTSVE